MEFWKDHEKLRVLLIIVLFAAGMTAVIFGWRMTGKMPGLCMMLLGIVCLLAALWIYNSPFQDKKRR